jgi:hypothetical protein
LIREVYYPTECLANPVMVKKAKRRVNVECV